MAIIPTQNTTAASSKVLGASKCQLFGFNGTTGATAGWFLVYNLTAVPVDGTVTPVKAYAVGTNSSIEVGYSPALSFPVGCTIAFSSTGPFTQTLSATAMISGEVN